jgi:hypothetical protein
MPVKAARERHGRGHVVERREVNVIRRRHVRVSEGFPTHMPLRQGSVIEAVEVGDQQLKVVLCFMFVLKRGGLGFNNVDRDTTPMRATPIGHVRKAAG